MRSGRPRLLKLSGEALGGEDGIFDHAVLARIASELVGGAQSHPVAVVVGGGNILRGATFAHAAHDPTRGDYMGMLATLINSLALRDAIERVGGRCEVMAPYAVPNVAVAYDRARAIALITEGVVVVFGGGTGHPFFTTDTAAALRAAEIGAGELLKGSKVDGVYSADPRRDPTAKRFERLSFQQAIDGRYAVMDLAAFELCRARGVDIRVFDMTVPGAISGALGPTPPGTLVTSR